MLSPDGVHEEDKGDKREPPEYDKEIECCPPRYELHNETTDQWSYGRPQKGGSIVDAHHGATFARVVDILRRGLTRKWDKVNKGLMGVAALDGGHRPPFDFPPALVVTSVCHMHHTYPRCSYNPHDNQHSGTLGKRGNAAPYKAHPPVRALSLCVRQTERKIIPIWTSGRQANIER